MYKIYDKTNNRFLIDRISEEVAQYNTIQEAENILKEYIECEFIKQGRLAVWDSDKDDLFEIMTTNTEKTIRPEPTVNTGVNLVTV